MRPQKGKATGSDDMFRARLDQIIDMRHALVLLAQRIDWDRIDDDIAEAFVATKGQQAVPTRFMIGLMLLKQISGLSDEAVREHWVINIYYQYVTEEDFFQHKIPHPTNAKLFYKALVQPNALAHREGVTLCQSYLRVGKKAQIMAARYAHAHQFKQQNREIKFLRTRLGRVRHDLLCKTKAEITCPKSSPCPCRTPTRSKSNGARITIGNSIPGMLRKPNVSVRGKPTNPMNAAVKSLSP